jgi:hypothetical protein
MTLCRVFECSACVTVIGQPAVTDISPVVASKKKGVLSRPEGETTGRPVGTREVD